MLLFVGAFLSEVILTFFLLMVICAATDSNKSNQVRVRFARSC